MHGATGKENYKMRERTILLGLSAALLCSAANQAFAQSSGDYWTRYSQTRPDFTPAPAPANSWPQGLHYHDGYYYQPSTSSLLYPPYRAGAAHGGPPNLYYPLPPSAFTPTPWSPYPPGYIPGADQTTGFKDFTPNAPNHQGVIHVFLPATDAAVYLNGQQVRGIGSDRKFITPTLPGNQPYQYWVTARFMLGGREVTQYRKVDVGPGEYVVADFTRPAITNSVNLPAGPVSQTEAYPVEAYRTPESLQFGTNTTTR
jgi:uncharacterized protein (TIGR03000 family)